MITLLGYQECAEGDIFVAKDGRCWQRSFCPESKKWGNPPDITICDCCTKHYPEVLQKMKELGLTHKNDGINPPTEEEWDEILRQVPTRPYYPRH